MPRHTPAPHAEAAQVKAKTPRHSAPQASEQTEKQPAATVKPSQTRFRTIIFNFSREHTEIDAKR